MSHRETLSLAHTAECKLKIAANKPDRNLRFLLGHALTLDSLNLRLMQIEDESRTVRQPRHSSSVKFKAADNGGNKRSPLSGRQKTPPPVTNKSDDDQDVASDSDPDELSLQRFPSAAAQPRRQPSPDKLQPPQESYDDVSSSDDEDLESFLAMLEKNISRESLEKITKSKTDEELASLYQSVKGCSCHETDAPEIKNFWEVPTDQQNGGMKGFENIRVAIAEVAA
ncbi:hypothetical protein BT63DRAFT_112091 [Microthyrium microscopicum]|uniref:Uncharacterized protein n=1 Tax=Microthyrium microscopicum TaxID=703497 RepID=A0A6A6TVM4_9PEZI|nr:hypothetical protein BT63DRAFT_112091 [Microthyrium microscopicum]